MTQEDIIIKYHLRELEECLNSMEDEVGDKINNGDYKTGETYFEIVLRAYGKSLLTLREIILLCTNGFQDGALGLARNLFEQFIIIYRFEIEKDNGDLPLMVKRYCADYDLQKLRNLKALYGYGNDPSQVQKIEAEIKKIKENYKIKRLIAYWWCDIDSFANLCNYVIEHTDDGKGMIQIMHISYKRACLSLHASNFGNSNRLGTSFDGIDLAPSYSGHEYALDLALKSFIMVVMVLYRELDLCSDDINKRLNEFAIYYSKMLFHK